MDRTARTCEKRVDTTVGVTASETDVVLSEFMALTRAGYGRGFCYKRAVCPRKSLLRLQRLHVWSISVRSRSRLNTQYKLVGWLSRC